MSAVVGVGERARQLPEQRLEADPELQRGLAITAGIEVGGETVLAARVLLRLKDLRRPRRVIARWHEAGRATPDTLHVDSARPVRFDGQIVGWMTLIAVPPQSDGRMTARVSWPDAADCLEGPDWLMGAISFERV